MSEANPVGRPSKYDPAFCEQCIAFMALGYSLTAFAGEISVSRATINNWMAEFPEFMEATRVGQSGRTKILERQLLATENGPSVNARIFALKNAAPEEWRDKREIESSGGINLIISQDDAKL